MKRNLIVFVIVVLLQIINTTAQETTLPVTITEGPIVERDKKPNKPLFSTSDNKGGFIDVYIPFQGFKKNPPGYKIDHYNDKLELVKSYMLPYNNNEIRGLMMANGKIHIIESFKNKKEKCYDFNVLSSSLDEFNFEKKNLASLDKVTFKEFFGFPLGTFKMYIKSSSDENKLAHITFSKKDNFLSINLESLYSKNVKLKSYVFDNNFQLVHKNEYVKEIKKRNFEISELQVNDQDGALYLLSKIKDKSNPKDKYRYELHRFTKDGAKQVSLEAAGHFVKSLFIVEDHQKIACVGFYSEDEKKSSLGVVRYSIDPKAFSISNASFNLFSEHFIVDEYTDNNKGKPDHNLALNSVFMDEKGDIIINAEEYFATSTTSQMMEITRTSGQCKDIISCKISEKGELLWARNINRITASFSPSYRSIVKDGKVYFIFRGSDKFRKDSRKPDEFSMFSSNALKTVFIVAMNQEGKLMYQKFNSNRDDIIYHSDRRSVLNQEKNEVIMFGGKRGAKSFLKVAL